MKTIAILNCYYYEGLELIAVVHNTQDALDSINSLKYKGDFIQIDIWENNNHLFYGILNFSWSESPTLITKDLLLESFKKTTLFRVKL